MMRKPNETFSSYCKRRTLRNKALKRYLQGKLIWDSYRWGTFDRDVSEIPPPKQKQQKQH